MDDIEKKLFKTVQLLMRRPMGGHATDWSPRISLAEAQGARYMGIEYAWFQMVRMDEPDETGF
jgi:hypothetical protein